MIGAKRRREIKHEVIGVVIAGLLTWLVCSWLVGHHPSALRAGNGATGIRPSMLTAVATPVLDK